MSQEELNKQSDSLHSFSQEFCKAAIMRNFNSFKATLKQSTTYSPIPNQVLVSPQLTLTLGETTFPETFDSCREPLFNSIVIGNNIDEQFAYAVLNNQDTPDLPRLHHTNRFNLKQITTILKTKNGAEKLANLLIDILNSEGEQPLTVKQSDYNDGKYSVNPNIPNPEKYTEPYLKKHTERFPELLHL